MQPTLRCLDALCPCIPVLTTAFNGKNLDDNLKDLVNRLKKKAYKPKPAKRVEIPKDNGKTRPLSIYCYEDKLVQEVLRRVLEAVFEPHFYDEMMGFRPNRGCHDALKKLNVMLEKRKTNWVLDADIKGFFDHLDHDWIVRFYELLKKRMGKFGLEIEENKTRLIEFGRFADRNRRNRGEGKPETFDFLGFTHYCSKARGGWFRVKRKTSKKKFAKACKNFHQKIKNMRTWKLSLIFKKVNQMLVGYYNYYGITDNGRSLSNLLNRVDRTLFYWLNRRSNKKSYTWVQYNQMKEYYPLAEPKIHVNIYDG